MVFIPGLGGSSFPGGQAGIPGPAGSAGATGPAGTDAQLGGAGYYYEFDDFVASSVALGGWLTSTSSGTVIKTTTGIDTANKGLGVISLTTGVSTSGFSAILKDTDFAIGGVSTFDQEWRIYIPTLSNVGNRYLLRIGLIDEVTSVADGVYFEYLESSSANWRCCTASNSSRTETASSVAVVAGSFIKLRIVYSPTEANFYINGSLVVTTSTNRPTGDGRSFGLCATIRKSAGSIERQLNIDYHKLTIDWTTDR